MKYDSDVRKELFEAAEEEFFVDHFGENNPYENYLYGIEVYHNAYISASAVIERLENGECLDNVKLNLAVQQLIIAHKSALQLRRDCDGRQIVNPGSLDIIKDAVELSMQGNQFLGNFGISKNLSDYERGKWYSLCAVNM